jgi:hypothetical protein
MASMRSDPLPDLVVQTIMSFLDIPSLLSASCACHSWLQIARGNELWRQHFQQCFHTSTPCCGWPQPAPLTLDTDINDPQRVTFVCSPVSSFFDSFCSWKRAVDGPLLPGVDGLLQARVQAAWRSVGLKRDSSFSSNEKTVFARRVAETLERTGESMAAGALAMIFNIPADEFTFGHYYVYGNHVEITLLNDYTQIVPVRWYTLVVWLVSLLCERSALFSVLLRPRPALRDTRRQCSPSLYAPRTVAWLP